MPSESLESIKQSHTGCHQDATVNNQQQKMHNKEEEEPEIKKAGATSQESDKSIAEMREQQQQSQNNKKDKSYLITQLRNGLTWGQDGKSIKAIIFQNGSEILHKRDFQTKLVPFMFVSSCELSSTRSCRTCDGIKKLMIEVKIKKEEAKIFAAVGFGVKHPIYCSVTGWCEICDDELEHVESLKADVKLVQQELDAELDQLTTAYELLRCDPSTVLV